jgi:transcriptional regulator with GAF, ATPase, and Fis domain
VSRRHCIICFEGGQALVSDMGSVQGIFVNGFSVPGQILSHGDRVRVGRSIFVYVDREEVDAALLTVTLADEEWNQPSEHWTGYEPARATLLQAFLRITASINSMRTADEIQPRVLEFILRVISVERDAMLLAGHDQDHFISSTYRRTGSQDDEAFPVDEALTRKVLREGAAVYEEKVACCPLSASGTTIGVIYAVMDPSGFELFTKGHMDVLASIAGFTAVALEHARYVTWLEGENLRLNEVINVEHGMIGESLRMKEVYQFIGRAGPTDRPVLITGETGTGKDLAARDPSK